MNRVRYLALAQKNHASQTEGYFANPTQYNRYDDPVFGWFTKLLPLLVDAQLYHSINFDVPYTHSSNRKVFQTRIVMALIPELEQTVNADGYPLLHYTLNERVFPDNKSLSEDEISRADGLGNTILMGEIQEGLPAWGAPGNARDPSLGLKPGANTFGVDVHSGVTVIGFADGRVLSMSNDIDPKVLKALSTPDGGEILRDEDWNW